MMMSYDDDDGGGKKCDKACKAVGGSGESMP